MTQDVELKELPTLSNSITSITSSPLQHLKEIVSLIDAGTYAREVHRILRVVRLTITLRKKLKASVISHFLSFVLLPGSELHSRLSSYLPKVTYQTELFLDKNKDYVIAEHQELLSASTCSFVSGLFPPIPEESSKTSKFVSIGSQFKQQLQSLLETLNAMEPHYVRCVKPNNLLKPGIFENQNVPQQLRCAEVLEAIRIRCVGFPTWKTFIKFVTRFNILAPDVSSGSYDEVTASKKIIEKVDLKVVG